MCMLRIQKHIQQLIVEVKAFKHNRDWQGSIEVIGRGINHKHNDDWLGVGAFKHNMMISRGLMHLNTFAGGQII